MSKMMLKMLADFAGITPEEITATVSNLQNVALNGVELLEEMNNSLKAVHTRLENIEAHIAKEREKADG